MNKRIKRILDETARLNGVKLRFRFDGEDWIAFPFRGGGYVGNLAEMWAIANVQPIRK